jgi:hypothetical protein
MKGDDEAAYAGNSLRDRNVRRLDPRALADESRSRHPSRASRLIPKERDPMGRMALYSIEQKPRATGTLIVECSSCRREKPVTVIELMLAALPFSIHLPVIRRFHSYMRCPSCGRRTWLRVRWEL